MLLGLLSSNSTAVTVMQPDLSVKIILPFFVVNMYLQDTA